MTGDAPLAALLADVARLGGRGGWFARVSEPLDPAERELAAALAATLPVAGRVEVVAIGDWHAALVFEQAADNDGVDWALAEAARESLWDAAGAGRGESALAQALDRVAVAVDDSLARALEAGRPSDRHPEAWAAAARGARLVVHDAALAELAGAPADHPARARYALAARGRWVLGYHAGRYGLA